jgi:hypothetical protein
MKFKQSFSAALLAAFALAALAISQGHNQITPRAGAAQISIDKDLQ